MRGGPKSRTQVREALPLFTYARDHAPVPAPPQDAPWLSSGLLSLDRILGGGFAAGSAALVAARPKVGASSLLLGATLTALKAGQRVSYFSEHLTEAQLRGRLIVLESRVNGYRFRAGFVSPEDKLALDAARERMPWHALNIVCERHIAPSLLDDHLFGYRPTLAIVDVELRPPQDSTLTRSLALEVAAKHLAKLARRHVTALVVRCILPRDEAPPAVVDLPGHGAIVTAFDSVTLLERHESTLSGPPEAALGLAEAHVVRRAGKPIAPETVRLRFDQRFAGLLDA